MNKASHCYYARCKCGCGVVSWVCVDIPEYQKDTVKGIADQIRRGYTVERGEIDTIGMQLKPCLQKGVQQGTVSK